MWKEKFIAAIEKSEPVKLMLYYVNCYVAITTFEEVTEVIIVSFGPIINLCMAEQSVGDLYN